MIFSGWKIGLDIQTEGVRAVAVQKHRQGWQLRQWWNLPFPSVVFIDNILSQPAVLLEVLDGWRKQLPRRFRLSVSFPTELTFQQSIPIPDKNLSAAVRENYVAYTAAKQLQLPASQLCYDYLEQSDVLKVTASRQSDLNNLLTSLASLQLYPDTVTPGDKVLYALPEKCNPQTCQYRVHEESDYWLWASCNHPVASGRQDKQQCSDLPALCRWLKSEPENIAFSTACPGNNASLAVQALDVWRLLTRLYPPLPQTKGRYTIALGLALGGTHR
ncbi:pilus assembly protein [Klebsiella sp. BIGb0407]|uniref:pilus assembly protein n=1 Tax=Klebsiella sp. BIGb0407 TaxID=2940603 RepID=UPI0021677FA8|nr:pilus assembly protein [Klebsiella sp. BIGb0407]MCS3432857.1 pilus assembly protein HofM [Klebsiella sp. BIGb0407]